MCPTFLAVSCPPAPAPCTIMKSPAGLAVYRFFRAAKLQVEMVLCLLLVKDWSMGTAPRVHSSSWSWGLGSGHW